MATRPQSGPPEASLCDLRRRVESLATTGGAFVVVAADASVRPVPASGLRFESRAIACEAARLAAAYRRALRRYDPDLPRYAVVARHERVPPD